MDKVRIGIIGLGNIGRFHAGYLLDGKIDRCELTAVCDAFEKATVPYAEKGLKTFTDGEEFIKSGEVDAVIVATPHFQHTTLGIAALEAGVHVMVEKPISAHKADAERLISKSKEHPDVVFGGMFQMRSEPRYQKIKQLIDAGELGEIVRITWIDTDWFRSDAYYQSSEWRATWKGEGGGVLINQCLHQLDTFSWMFGMPAKVRGFAQLGKFHDIEVEDNITAYMEFANGATGTFLSSTGEIPGTNRLEIAGHRGKLVLDHDKLTFIRNEVSADEWNKTSKIGFAQPDQWTIDIPFGDADMPHAGYIQNFVNAILDGAPLNVPGAEGINSIELANAMIYSSLIDQTVELPLDAKAWEDKLNELIEKSQFEKKVVEAPKEDFTKSFRK